MKKYVKNPERKGNLIEEMENILNVQYTENGAKAYKSTGSPNLDLFSSIASLRNVDIYRIKEIFYLFEKAYAENHELAVKMIFWLRDVRGGAGERKTFRQFLVYLANRKPEIISDNLSLIPEYGRFDDLLILLDTPLRTQTLLYIKEILMGDARNFLANQPITLLSKWLPSENASSPETIRYAKIIRKALGLSPKLYRQYLSTMRNQLNVVERKMSARKWYEIDFQSVPSRASMLYAQVFANRCGDKYLKFLEDVALGKVNIKTSTLYPYDIVNKVLANQRKRGYKTDVDNKVLNLLWQNLPDYLEGEKENILCMVDTSGSMFCGETISPIDIALSLGIYTAERNSGVFQNKFLTFSANPALQTICGETIQEKVQNLENSDWGMNTNLERAFDLILNAAINSHTDPNDMISKLIIISDMEFDVANAQRATGYGCNYKIVPQSDAYMPIMKKKFEQAGYIMPSIVYWNVDARSGVVHATKNDIDFCMVSGASPSIFKGIFKGEIEIETVNEKGEIEVQVRLDPFEVMKQTLLTDRYAAVKF